MATCELKLETIFGNQIRVRSYHNNEIFNRPDNSVTLVLDDKGIVITRDELEKFKKFIAKI